MYPLLEIRRMIPVSKWELFSYVPEGMLTFVYKVRF